ncbi:MAG: hypothetical protein LBB42_03345 [Coriobacteriales bacterium]|jgi:hypothetical protein|nr:hypothetical protein [Coriobacteriales bacterium]
MTRLSNADGYRELELLQKTAQEFQHGVRKQGDDWKLFELSYFVYAFFSFNSFYSVNWDESLISSGITSHEYIRGERNPREGEKIDKFVSFICGQYPKSKYLPDEYYNLVKKRWGRLKWEIGSDDHQEKRTLRNAVDKLRDIRPCGDLDEDHAEVFRKDVTSLLSEDPTQRRKDKDVFKEALCSTLKTVYKVRNNIFHGKKMVSQIVDDSGQRLRVLLYATLLLAANELLLEAVAHQCEQTAN